MANSQSFAISFGDALRNYLRSQDISDSEASRRMGLGHEGSSRIGTYCKGTKHKKKGHVVRAIPSAEFLYLVSATFPDFQFEFRGYKISPTDERKPQETDKEQLRLPFERQFYLNDGAGEIRVSLRRPAGRVEIDLTLRAVS